MKSHFLKPGVWARGKDVQIRDAYLRCQLDYDRVYPLIEESAVFVAAAHASRQPHTEFLQVDNEQGFVRFVERWGPIALAWIDREAGQTALPVGRYWMVQRYLQRLVGLLTAFRTGCGEPESLGEFLELRSDQIGNLTALSRRATEQAPSDPKFVAWLDGFAQAVWTLPTETDWIGVRRGGNGEMVALLRTSPIHWVRRLMDLAISACLQVPIFSLPRRPKGLPGSVVPSVEVDELWKALEYRIILDEWSAHPLHRCHECGEVFRAETRRPRKYCSQECGRRVSSRMYKRSVRTRQQKKNNGGRRRKKQ